MWCGPFGLIDPSREGVAVRWFGPITRMAHRRVGDGQWPPPWQRWVGGNDRGEWRVRRFGPIAIAAAIAARVTLGMVSICTPTGPDHGPMTRR